MFVNILAAAIASGIAIRIAGDAGLNDYVGTTFAIVVMTLVLLFFGEISPKLITVKRPIKFASIFSYPIFFFEIILKPFSIIFQGFTSLLIKKVFQDDTNTLNNHDIESAIKIGHKEGIIDTEEKEMFENVFDSMTKEVQEIMIPKKKMPVMDITTPLNKLAKKFSGSDNDFIPIYKKTRDNITGVIRKKDLLPYHFHLQKSGEIKRLIRPVLYVPEGKNIVDLLKELQKEKLQFSIVVDEYGNLMGFIPLDELIEKIVGEYKDEYDREDVFIRKLGKKQYLIKGDMKIEDFNKRFSARFRSKEANTINGLVLEKSEKIPGKGEKIILDKFSFTISRRKGPIIDTLIVEKTKE